MAATKSKSRTVKIPPQHVAEFKRAADIGGQTWKRFVQKVFREAGKRKASRADVRALKARALRARERQNGGRVAFLGPEVSRTGAYFDRDAIARAANFRALGVGGIEAPLSIYFYTRTRDVGVTEDGRRTGPEIGHAWFHEGVNMIGVADDLSPDEARWVLAHELRHSVGGSHGEAECNDWADVVSTAHPNIIRDVRV